MSAFMCSDRHLTALAAYAVRHGLSGHVMPDYPTKEELRAAIRTTLGVLARENMASLDARYPGDNGQDVGASVDPLAVADGTFDAITIIKACHCYAYQACEHTGWADSQAKKIVGYIEAHAARSLPGYEAAPWGL